MHWYLYSVKDDYVNMLLDHNITEAEATNGRWAQESDYNDESAASAGITYPGVSVIPEYGSSFYYDDTTYRAHSKNARGPVTALNTLKLLTSEWNGTQTPIVPNSSNMNEYIITKDKNYNKYQIDYTGYKARSITYEETGYLGCSMSANSCPLWMTDNIYSSEAPKGYWTSTACSDDDSNFDAWGFVSSGGVFRHEVFDLNYGVRPVITVKITDVLTEPLS